MGNGMWFVPGMIEELETRALRDATLVNGIITVTGTSGNDIVVVRVDPANPTQILVAFNDQGAAAFKISDAAGISIDTGDGDDRIGFDQSNGAITLATTILAGAGNDKVDG